MSKTEHTPLPWQIKSYYDETTIIGNIDGPDDGQYHYETITDSVENPANAALIVKAVNCHAELVEALKTVVEECKKYSGDTWEEHPMQDVIKSYHYVQIALAKAGAI